MSRTSSPRKEVLTNLGMLQYRRAKQNGEQRIPPRRAHAQLRLLLPTHHTTTLLLLPCWPLRWLQTRRR